MHYTNAFNQKVGYPIPDWHKAQRPASKNLTGSYCVLEPLDPLKHAKSLYESLCLSNEDSSWTYLPYGPFLSLVDFERWLKQEALGADSLFYAILDAKTTLPVGLISYFRIKPDHGVIEIAHVHFSPKLKRSTAATEAVYLMLREAFENLGYRRCEWKCNALNEGSKKAAVRLGFTHEGLFRQDRIFKGNNRDTDWYSIIDSEWEALRARLEQWLEPANFNADGHQKTSLSHS